MNQFMEKIKEIFVKDDIGNPPYTREFLLSLDEKDYPQYLKKIFKLATFEELNLKHPRTFNEKIQWLKLYDNLPIKTQLTDKVLVRDWVKEKIGAEYLKPMLWAGKSFDEIPFDALPEQFIIKCNHGCKWHYVIKNKEEFLKIKPLFQTVKNKFDGWMNDSFFFYAGFEMHYKNIKPQILIEKLLCEENSVPIEYEIYCFNGEPEIFQKVVYNPSDYPEAAVYDKNFKQLGIYLNPRYKVITCEAEDVLKKAVNLSKTLAYGFKLVRVDWMRYKGHIYFNEMTFTPMSGFFRFEDKNINIELGLKLNLKGDK